MYKCRTDAMVDTSAGACTCARTYAHAHTHAYMYMRYKHMGHADVHAHALRRQLKAHTHTTTIDVWLVLGSYMFTMSGDFSLAVTFAPLGSAAGVTDGLSCCQI